MNRILTVIFTLSFSFLIAQDEFPSNEYFLGIKAIKNHDFDSAKTYFYTCLESDPNQIIYLNSLGEALINNREYKKAIPYFLKIDQKKKNSVDYELAKIYALTSNFDSAFYYLESHLNSRYKKYKSEIQLDADILLLKNDERWNKLWKKEWYSKFDHQIADVRYQIKIKNYKLAESILIEIFDKRKTAHEALYLSAILNKNQTFYHAALREVELAIEKRKRNDEYLYLQSQLLFQLDKKHKALQAINKAIEVNMFELEYYELKSKILNELKEYSEAIELYNYVLKFKHHGYKELYYLSEMYYNAENNIRALKNINKALKINSNNKDLYILRGKIYLASKLYQYAINDFTMALDFDYQNAEVYFLRGNARFQLDNAKGACRDWHKARNLNYVEAEEYLRKHCIKLNSN